MVIVSHWFPSNVLNKIPLGSIGVDIFFVLSGFLITGILLRERNSDKTLRKVILSFYFRRTLRIFPLYYGVLIGLVLINSFLPNAISKYFIYFVSYTQNFLFLSRDSFLSGKVGHFWSLAVEEQFYLFWPWFVLLIPKKFLYYFFVLVIIFGLTCSVYFSFFLYKGNSLVWAHPLVCVHAFGIGGLLSWILFENFDLGKMNSRYVVVFFVTFVLYILSKILFPEYFTFDRFLISIMASGLIFFLIGSNNSTLSTLFSNFYLVEFGKISYGIYVFHNFVPSLLNGVLLSVKKRLNYDLIPDPLSNFDFTLFYLGCFIILCVVSKISFVFYESRFLKLKNFFV